MGVRGAGRLGRDWFRFRPGLLAAGEGHGGLEIPAVSYASPYGIFGYFVDACPYQGRMGNAVNSDHQRASLIGALNGAGGPTYVAGFVVPVVVDPVKRKARRRPGSNRSEERLKARVPFGAYGDSTPPVIAVGAIARLVAARTHGFPNQVFRRLLTTARVPMRHSALGTTPAGNRSATYQVVMVDGPDRSTFATTEPPRHLAALRCRFQNYPASESFSDHRPILRGAVAVIGPKQ